MTSLVPADSGRRQRNGRHVDADGTVRWYKNGALHREDGPAVEEPSGRASWYLNGVYGRLDAGPTVIREDGARLWLDTAGQPHREDGPAVVRRNGQRQWYQHGKEHRLDGPAMDFGDGKLVLYYVNDTHVPDGGDLLPTLDPRTLTSVLSLYRPGDTLEVLVDAVRAAAS